MEVGLLTPLVLQAYASNELRISMAGDTVGDLLLEVRRQYPALHNCLCDETGRLRPHINLFLGNKLIARGNSAAKLRPGDVVSVFQAVSGG